MGDYANYLVPERYRIDAPEREDMERRMIGLDAEKRLAQAGERKRSSQDTQ